MKMKGYFTLASFVILVFISLINTSCKTDTPPIDDTDTSLQCSTDSVIFSEQKDAQIITINTTANWTINADANWISFTATSGKGKTAILVGSLLNPGLKRSAHVTIVSGKNQHEISIKQTGATKLTITINSISFTMLKVNGGQFTMGETLNNTPDHSVQLTDFYISETEITNAVWQSVTGSLPYSKSTKFTNADQGLHLQQPVTAVSWNNINDEFLPALKTKTGIEFGLPTEAQWEFAALGGIKSKAYNFAGSNNFDNIGWDASNSGGVKQDVKQKDPNELGLYDMSGNAAEWCKDWYAGSYAWEESYLNPVGASTGTYKVLRGGNYDSSAGIFGYNECRVKQRKFGKPSGTQGAWGDIGTPDEPQIFICDPIGFRIVVAAK